MNRKIIIAFGIILLVILILFFYPKSNGYEKITIAGYMGGMDCACFGIEKSFNSCFPSKCTDTGSNHYCFGIPTGKCICQEMNLENGKIERVDCDFS